MGWVEKRGNRWVGFYRDADGRRHRAGSGTTKRAAERLYQDREAGIRGGTWHDPTAGKVEFSRYFEQDWLPFRTGAANTLQKYRVHYRVSLHAAFGTLELRRITRPVVQRWVSTMEKQGVSPATIEGRFITLQLVLAARQGSSALRDGLIPANPCAGVTRPSVERRRVNVYSVEEADTLITTLDPWWRPLVLLAVESGLRWGELMGLRVEDFTEGCHAVHVRRTITEISAEVTGNGTPFAVKNTTKGGRDRFVALSPEAATMVATVIHDRRLFGQDRLFSMPSRDTAGLPLRTAQWPDGRPIGRTYFGTVWRRTHVEADIERDGRRFHDLRASHVSWLLAGGADLATVMTRVGHQQLQTTQRYLSALADADTRALDALAATRARYRRV
jgi:integrase